MKLLLLSATELEVGPILSFCDTYATKESEYSYQYKGLQIDILITGVGQVNSSYHLMKYIQYQTCDQAIIMGIGGISDPSVPLGSVYLVSSDEFADLGTEDQDGELISIFAMGLQDPDQYPFTDGKLESPNISNLNFLPHIRAVSVHRILGNKASIEKHLSRYDETILESMEGAALSYCLLQERIPFLHLRAVSNYIEPRNRENWQIQRAVESLNEVVQSMIQAIVDTDTQFQEE